MKNLKSPWVMGLLTSLIFTAFSQITPIKDIQFTGGPAGDSPLLGQTVTISGIVTAEHRGDVYANGGISGSYFFVMDSAGAWCGIQIFYSAEYAAEGDSVTITGVVGEYNNQTQIGNVTDFTVHSSQRELPGPIDVTTEAVDTSEAYEGCLVRVMDVDITETGIGSYNNWRVDDGSGDVLIDTRAQYFFTPVLNDSLRSLTGIVLSYKDEYSIAPRLAWDIVEAGEFTRIQRIQQVRNSDLLRTPVDDFADMSYACDPTNASDSYRNYDILSIKGVVTMPTGLSYAGDGVKFILAEEGGGPWSAILSYNEDSTKYPVLFEGDLIKMTGDVGEYRTNASNMTEFWSTTNIDILGIGEDPAPASIETGDISLPVSAEQWGNVMVYVKDAPVVDVNINPQDGIFAVDDGSGSLIVDNDSDSLYQYYNSNPLPPLGTIADSIRGWIYHHFGGYADSTAYKIAPLYLSDIVWGIGPPAITNQERNLGIPSSTDIVTVQADVATNLTISEVALYYEVMGVSADYTKVVMNNVGGETYAGDIPEQADGSFVNYYIVATDDQNQSTTLPADTSVQNLCYKVIDGVPAIYDIQYTPWSVADTPFEGANVEITGIVTVDTNANNIFGAYCIQDDEAEWSGIFVDLINEDLKRGDEITVFGTVTEYNPPPAYDFQWDNNTVILTDSFKVLGSGNSVNPMLYSTGQLTDFDAGAEPLEGVLVKVMNATLIRVNGYDVTFDDGTGECRVDGDFMLARDQDANNIFYVNDADGYLVAFGDTIRPGDKVNYIQGVFIYSYGTYKIELRDNDDFGVVVGINPDFEPIPLSYNLKQNFPNPFNPSTRIYFEVPQTHKVKMVIYNILGQKVRTLVDENFNAGRHIINWDGRNDIGIQVPTGIYIYRIKAGDFISSRKMLMVK